MQPFFVCDSFMKFTLSWLKEHLTTETDIDTLSETLTAIGLEVEDISDASEALSDFTVAEIISAEKHPDADKLQVCKVRAISSPPFTEGTEGGHIEKPEAPHLTSTRKQGEEYEELQIVCGAPNARAGIKVALAKVGARIPNGDFKIKKSKIRGVESSGMMCSANELNLGDDHAGIIELPEDAAIGTPIAEVLGLNDPVIEIAITPNRGDCLGVYGIARDLAAAGLGTLRHPRASIADLRDIYQTDSRDALNALENDGLKPSPISIELKSEHCPIFVGRVIKGVKNNPSPDWLQQRLLSIGLRPISTLVDITNYITFTYGRPLHVYDVAKLNGNITVRDAVDGEEFDALNDKHYKVEAGMCVIADDEGMLGLGGVVGGVPSGVTEETTDVLLECAWFDPIHIAENGRALSIDSDARYRFERTVDPAFVKDGADIASQLIIDLCGGEACDVFVAGEEPINPTSIDVSADFINTLGGINLCAVEQIDILQRLGFACEADGDKNYTATVPSWRPDVTQQADIAEEVLRIFGYNNVEAVSLPKCSNTSKPAISQKQRQRSNIARTLANNGLHETHSWAFLSAEKAELFGGGAEDVQLLNPISNDLGMMRPSLLPHLIDALNRNAARGISNLGLFEIGPQFIDASPAGQKSIACAVRLGEATSKQWNEAARNVDLFDAKADALAALQSAGVNIDKVQIVQGAPNHYHPGRSGVIQMGPKNILAYFGELHPATLQALDCEQTVVACEIMLDTVSSMKQKTAKNIALQTSDYQAVDRDFAFIVDENQAAGDVLNSVKNADKNLIRSARLFDVYQGKGVEDGKKSLALTIKLQADDHTLTDEEIEAVSNKVVQAADKYGAKLRA